MSCINKSANISSWRLNELQCFSGLPVYISNILSYGDVYLFCVEGVVHSISKALHQAKELADQSGSSVLFIEKTFTKNITLEANFAFLATGWSCE